MATVKHLIFFSLIFNLLFFVTPNPAFGVGKQEIYLLQNLDIGQFQKKLEQENTREEEIKDLIEKKILVEINQEIAKQKFDMQEWYNNDNEFIPVLLALCKKNNQHFPRLAVAKMKNSDGYGLFALDHILPNHYIAEYTGEVITDEESYRKLPNINYVIDSHQDDKKQFKKIDALHSGGAARFAKNLPYPHELSSQFNLEKIDKKNIATSNSDLAYTKFNNGIYLISTVKINAGTQIGYNYRARDKRGCVRHYMTAEPTIQLFYNNGEAISKKLYEKTSRDMLILPDKKTNPLIHEIFRIPDVTNEILIKIQKLPKVEEDERTYIQIDLKNDQLKKPETIFLDLIELSNQILKTGDIILHMQTLQPKNEKPSIADSTDQRENGEISPEEEEEEEEEIKQYRDVSLYTIINSTVNLHVFAQVCSYYVCRS